jgi:hypothetical protein
MLSVLKRLNVPCQVYLQDRFSLFRPLNLAKRLLAENQKSQLRLQDLSLLKPLNLVPLCEALIFF